MDPTFDHRETRHRMGFATEWTFWNGPGVLHHIHQADASQEDIVSLCGVRIFSTKNPDVREFREEPDALPVQGWAKKSC